MKLTTEQSRAMRDWYGRYSGGEEASKGEVAEILQVSSGPPDYDFDGIWVDEVDPEDFDPDDIADELTERRLERLQEGAEPTKKEIRIWTEKRYEDLLMGDGPRTYHFYLYKIHVDRKVLWFLSLHGCGGCMDDFSGPYDSKREALSGAGRYE